MEITRNVILDLLPLYLADEASTDTRALVDAHLAADSELADIVRQSAAAVDIKEQPMPLQPEQQMQDFLEAKRIQQRTTMIWAALIGLGLFGVLLLALMAALFLFRAG